jgi:glycosyltransferase involved in cell wall biosynthesis
VRTLQIVFYGDPNGYPPIINAVRALAEAGWSVEIVCRGERSHGEVRWPAEATLVRSAAARGGAWREYAAFVRLAWKHAKPGAIIAGHDMHGLLPAALMARKAGSPLVYHCHDFADAARNLPAGSRIVKAFEPMLARRAALVVVPDERRGAVMRRELGLREPPLVVPNAPRALSIAPPGRLHEALASRGHARGRIVLRQGRIGPGHGIEATIRSMPRWTDPSASFVLMGPGEADFVRRISALAAECGVAERVVVLAPVPYDEVAGFTREADVGHALYDPVNVNHVEMGTASNKVIEYMAAGIPSIVADTPSFRELLSRARFGLAADPSSEAAIAEAVNRILDNPALAAELAAAGRRAFETDLQYDRHAAVLRERLAALGAAG